MNVAIVMQPKSGIVNLSIWSAGKGARFFSLGRRRNLILMGVAMFGVMALWLGSQVYLMANNAGLKASEFTAVFSVGTEVDIVKSSDGKVSHITTAKPRGWLRQLVAKFSPKETPHSRVVAYDGSRLLSRGTKVVLNMNGLRTIAEVAGAPNETVLLLRGSAPDRLYVLGDASYAVMADHQSKVVRASDITATIDDGPVRMARN